MFNYNHFLMSIFRDPGLLRLALPGLVILAPVPLAAQAPDANSILQGASTQLTQMAGPIINIVSLVLGLVGAVMLGYAFWKHSKGDPSSQDALTKIAGGLLIAVVILQVIRMTFLSGMA